MVGDPTISVIIPTRDRPARLAECLGALARQDYRRDAWEIVVVDDGSAEPDRVATALAPMRDRLDIRLMAQKNAGPAAARNAGATGARFDYLAFTDDDCLPRPDWLSGLASEFRRTPDALLGGAVVNGLPTNLCSESSHQLVAYVVDYFLREEAPFFPSNNLAMPRPTFDAIGGFDVRFRLAAGEDRDLCAKCRRMGIPLLAARGAIVEHRHALDLSGLLRQHFNYGRGAFMCRQLEVARGASSFRIEPLRFYIDLVRAPFQGTRLSRDRLSIAALLLVCQAVNAAGFFAERFRTRTHERAGPALRSSTEGEV